MGWSNGANAVFPGIGADYTVTLQSGVTVKNITLAGGAGMGQVTLDAAVQNDVLSVADGAVWDVGGRTLRVFNDFPPATNLQLAVNAGQTLTVTDTVGGGALNLDTVGIFWTGVSGAALNVLPATDGITLRGGMNNVGAFSSVKIAGGSTYFHQRNNGGIETYSNPWELGAGDVTFDRAVNNNNGAYRFSGAISGAGRLIAAAGGGNGDQFVLNGVNTYGGGTIVRSGRLVLENPDALPNSATTSIEDGAALVINTDGGNFSDAQIAAISAGVSGATDTSYLGLRTPNFVTVAANLSGNHGLMSGGGDVILTGANTYTGETLVDQGVLFLGADNTLPATTLLNVRVDSTGGQFDTNGFSQTIGGLISTDGGGDSGTKQIRNSAAGVSVLTINTPAGLTAVYDRNINDNQGGAGGRIDIVKNGAGIQIIDRAAVSSWTGSVAINQGGFGFNSVSTIPTGGVSVAAGATLYADVGGAAEFLEADINSTLGATIAQPVSIASNSYIGFRTNADADEFTYTSDLGVQSAAGTTLGVKKIGNGTVILSGANTYDGSTSVSGGRLVIDGDFTNANGVYTSARGGNLAGNGLIGGNVVVDAGGVLAPGSPTMTGTLSLNNTSLTMGPDLVEGDNTILSGLNINLNGADQTIGASVNDLITGVGNLTLDGALNIYQVLAADSSNDFTNVQLGDAWTVLQYSGTLTDNGAVIGAAPGALSPSLALSIDTSIAGQVRIVAVAGAGQIGDYNSDGFVDAADYTVWRDNLGTNFALPNRDPANMGVISNADYTTWKSNFGLPAAGGALSGGAVPEPGGLVLLAFAVAGGLLARRRRRQA
ncbi:Autotransporter-associated beta strand repeat protein [Pirellulimonas nuda]|uniref:Autotransporter-associated beta strand repeat protein n=1 Tax=Pirellulimonas nuda TaxID=2528009 RepID=A0A518DJF3_9BACT|nr:autotransporter-associated beta strand repeat-containing protein [Pirellulimonas nuda]QDU91607.1 Autotransporter-associated beta strand repeat protein [Pirellulimonas nuda]